MASRRTHFNSIGGKLDALQRSSFKIWRLLKLLTQIVTRCKSIPSKSNYLQKNFGAKNNNFKISWFKTWGIFKKLIKIWLFSELLIFNFFFAIAFFRRIKRFKWPENCQFWSCYRVKVLKKHFFWNWVFQRTLFFKKTISLQSLMRCKFFDSKTDGWWKSLIKF